MSPEKPRDLAASIYHRLLALARDTRQDFQLVLTRYALERFLYRLGKSPHADTFVLKGAMLFQAWTAEAHRPTRDVDFLARGTHSTERFREIFIDVLSQASDQDAVIYLPESVIVETMKDEEQYPGLRISAQARLGKARITLLADIGFGDAITPAPTVMDYPTLLPLPAPRLLTYPIESVVSEKFEAMVKLGIANSRMKDFFDVWVLARDFSFDGTKLVEAVTATFERRRTPLPSAEPLALTPEFYDDATKKAQWTAFISKNKLSGLSLSETITAMSAFLVPVLQAARTKQSFPQHWSPGGPWV